MLSLGDQWFLHISQVWVWIFLGLQLRLTFLHKLLKCTGECTNCVCKKWATWGKPWCHAWHSHADGERTILFWDGVTVGGCAQVPNPHCICPQTVTVSIPHHSAFAVLFGGSTAEHGSWGGWVARKNTFLESPFESYFFVKINTFYRSIWTGKYHDLHSEINSTVMCINMHYIYI